MVSNTVDPCFAPSAGQVSEENQKIPFIEKHNEASLKKGRWQKMSTAILIIIEGHKTAYSFQWFLVPAYYWKTIEKPETDPQLLWEWQ